MVARSLQALLLLLAASAAVHAAIDPLSIGGACCGAAALTAAASLKIVTTGNTCLIERMGRFHRQLNPGWHWTIPILETSSMYGTVREQVMDVPPQQCYTRDNAPVQADAVIYLRVFEMQAARYNVADLQTAIMNLVLTQLREEMGKLTLDETFSSRDRMNRNLLEDVNLATRAWGVEVTRVEVRDIEPSPDIVKAMELQMSAERQKRATVLDSEASAIQSINDANAKATSLRAQAEAEKDAVVLAAEATARKMDIEAGGLARSLTAVAEGDASRRSLMLPGNPAWHTPPSPTLNFVHVTTFRSQPIRL
mmetsp:Transcript_40395/g.92723  ORF Transcript_40395/g.92723 Transcript_40395/m.92723 type:complete len:309 (+) Transcript_40395:177-1103(+)